MVYFILVLKEVAIVLFLLSTVPYFIYLLFDAVGKRKEYNDRIDTIGDAILQKIDDDSPVMLNVSQERLIEKVADEIERRSLGRE